MKEDSVRDLEKLSIESGSILFGVDEIDQAYLNYIHEMVGRNGVFNDSIRPPVTSNDFRRRFENLSHAWIVLTELPAVLDYDHWAYRAIVNLGMSAVPFILQKMCDDHWWSDRRISRMWWDRALSEIIGIESPSWLDGDTSTLDGLVSDTQCHTIWWILWGEREISFSFESRSRETRLLFEESIASFKRMHPTWNSSLENSQSA